MSAPALKIDRGIPSRLEAVPETARSLEQQGYDGCWTGEIAHDPFLPLLLAAEHTSRLQIGTSIAVAFARSPMTVANLGWDLQAYSKGRFILGLGSQIRPHIEKRFSMPWSHPVGRMREFVAALHAIWDSWRDGSRLEFAGDFYRHTLMTPMFTPEPHEHGTPPVFLAAVGEAMTEMAGEVADGLLAHAFTTRRYLDEVTLPTLARGADRAGRETKAIEVSCPVFVVTGETEVDMDNAAAATRKQLAFYASTPAYRAVLEVHGWGGLQPELHRLSKAGRWDEMGSLIDDAMLDAFAVVAPPDDVAAKLRLRCAGAIGRVLPAFPSDLPETRVAAILQDVRDLSPVSEETP
ncbi:LLM class F420-dependent oxidoreductase [Mycolicibacterium sp. S2-37]|uniref:LLM class F420-dependent oxidoreductase n=1 Tax=Mycolicibacterium sp. S2-37 TaxID=2810297 RepID=UPI001A93C4FB|nr:LLM class F420-dependent oxidoreductase [Mycolicibacterium sp. S2-37]MBO0677425.1 LLM class F420-dependent oxidoreductase [Mycolicibacterium sp. S2-37]